MRFAITQVTEDVAKLPERCYESVMARHPFLDRLENLRYLEIATLEDLKSFADEASEELIIDFRSMEIKIYNDRNES